MAFHLYYHPSVKKVDVPRIDRKMRDRLQRAIQERLLSDPHQYGTSLRRGLHGFYKLRVGDYRIVYEIVGNEIRIYIIAHRKSVYTDVVRRLSPNRT